MIIHIIFCLIAFFGNSKVLYTNRHLESDAIKVLHQHSFFRQLDCHDRVSYNSQTLKF
jgi:hypothetical protein